MHKITQNFPCVTSSSPGNQVDGLPGGVSTGAVVASWDPDRRATIHESDMKNKGFDQNRKLSVGNIPIFHKDDMLWQISCKFSNEMACLRKKSIVGEIFKIEQIQGQILKISETI